MSMYPHREQPHYVYRCYDEAGALLYIGCTYHPMQRMTQHIKRSPWFRDVAQVRFIVFPDKDYALRKEREAILNERPANNRPWLEVAS